MRLRAVMVRFAFGLIGCSSVAAQNALPVSGTTFPDISARRYVGDLSSFLNDTSSIWIVEFWASWCQPCRQYNWELNQYLDSLQHADSQARSKIKVLGIAMDEDTMVWKKAMRNDESNWDVQICDTMVWNGFSTLQIGIRYLPYNFILDSKKIIRGQGIYGEHFRQKMKLMLIHEVDVNNH